MLAPEHALGGCNMNWRIIVAGVVVFVVGVGVGGLAEHERVKHETHKAAARTTTTTGNGESTTAEAGSSTTEASTASWFAGTKAACPALKRWQNATAATYRAMVGKATWASARAALLTQMNASSAAVGELIPLATPTGRVELNFLAAYQIKATSAVRHATSAAGFSQAQSALTDARVKNDAAVMSRVEVACS
jgi:hypothetical protein